MFVAERSGASSLQFIYIHQEQKQQMLGYTYVFGYAKHTKQSEIRIFN